MSSLNIEIPDSVFEQIEPLATKDGLSVEAYIAKMLTRQATLTGSDYIRRRAQRGSAERMLKFLSKVPNVPPDPWDRLD